MARREALLCVGPGSEVAKPRPGGYVWPGRALTRGLRPPIGGLTSAQLLAQGQPVSLHQDVFETEQQFVAEALRQCRHTLRPWKTAGGNS